MLTKPKTISPIQIGSRVYHIDPRHVGVVLAISPARLAKVEWEERKWVSYLPITSLNPAVEVCERCNIVIRPNGDHLCGDCGEFI